MNVKNTDDKWKNLQINKKESFEMQCKDKRQPRISWNSLQKQINPTIIFQGGIDEL